MQSFAARYGELVPAFQPFVHTTSAPMGACRLTPWAGLAYARSIVFDDVDSTWRDKAEGGVWDRGSRKT